MTLPVLTMKLYAPGAAVASPKATLTRSFNRSFMGHFNDAGGGTLTLNMSDADLASVAYEDWVRCFINGTVVFTWIVEQIKRTVVDVGEEKNQVAVLSGRGFGALLDRAKVYPPFGVRPLRSTDTRTFGFAGIAYDHSAWTGSPYANQQSNTAGGNWDGAPAGWPDSISWWIYGQPAGSDEVVGDSYYANVGVSPIASFTLAEPTTVRVFVATDNGGEVWVDETLIYSLAANPNPVGWNSTQAVDLDLDAGDHFVAMKLTNFGPFVGFNPGGIMLTVYTLVAGGAELDTSILRTESTAAWKYVPAPAGVPGSTPGRIVGQFLTEADDRGVSDVTTDFDDDDDSNGDPWASTTDMGVAVGTKGLSLLQQLAEAYCDFDFDADFPVLHLYNAGGTDRSAAVTLAPGSNLTGLVLDGSCVGLANVLIIRYGGGYAEVVNSASVAAHGRHEEFLSLGAQPTEAQVTAIANALFDRVAAPEVGITATVHPALSPVGYLNYFPGDTVTCTGESGPEAVRVIAITVAEDINGVVTTTPELNSLREEHSVNLARQINRMVPGTLPSSLS